MRAEREHRVRVSPSPNKDVIVNGHIGVVEIQDRDGEILMDLFLEEAKALKKALKKAIRDAESNGDY